MIILTLRNDIEIYNSVINKNITVPAGTKGFVIDISITEKEDNRNVMFLMDFEGEFSWVSIDKIEPNKNILYSDGTVADNGTCGNSN